MKKALIVMAVLAIVAPASAGNLPTGDAIYYYASWGGLKTSISRITVTAP